MKRLLLYIALILLPLTIFGEDVKSLQKQQKQLQKQIENTNKMLEQTKSSEKATVNKLELIGQNIKAQKQMIRSLDKEINALDAEMSQLTERRNDLQTELESLKADYARLIRETHYAQMQQSPLIFLFSSSNFQQLLRRIRYMQEFARYRHEQVNRIEHVQEEIDEQNNLLRVNRSGKQTALKNRKREEENLARDERKQQQMLSELQKKKGDLVAQLKKQQKKAADLNKKIDDMIKKQTQAKTTLTKEQQLVAGGFEQNKGRLPWPVEQGTISGQFGKHQHPVYKDVTIENKGIYLQTVAGASARAVFEGEVSSCFMMNNNYAVIVQHGNYRSVYAGLSKLSVKQGDKVTAKQKLGTIYTDSDLDNKTELYFQIYKDRDIQNPTQWLSK